MSAGFCQEVDAISDRLAWVNTTLAHRPAADVSEVVGKLAADFGELVSRSLADLPPEVAARALAMADQLRELAEAERR